MQISSVRERNLRLRRDEFPHLKKLLPFALSLETTAFLNGSLH